MSDHPMEFRVLGPLEILSDGRTIRIDSPKQRALLAVLLIHANEAVSTDRLLDLVWEGDGSEVGISTLRYHVSKLRESLGVDGVVVTQAPGYALEVDRARIDAVRFEGLADKARSVQSDDPVSALALLDEALALWRGDPYAEFAYEEFAHLEVERLAEKRRGIVEDRIGVLLALGRHQEIIPELEALAAAHPHRERLWGQLALALYRSGRQADAVTALQQARDQLAGMGLDLSPPLKEIEERVFAQDPTLLADVSAPDTLRGYVLRGVIGEGAHGVVWRAAQPGIGREVALKAIRPELANQPEFVRRFEAEAQLVAALEHPNIVSLYDFWRDPEGAYLVMPYLRGGNLAGVLQQGPLDPPAVLDLVTAIGAALGHAHRRGVVHRDVTPHNVLLDEDGNPYLADFGMAALLGGEGPPATSSPAYMSPEASTGQKAVVQSDVFSLGVLVHASLTGRLPVVGEELPLVSELRHDLSRAVDDVLSCATSPEVVHRYTAVGDFVDALAHAIGVSREDTPRVAIAEHNPFKGLRAFEETDAADFFGREMLVSELVQAVARHRLVGVVGPSGCGKSSLVRAGVVPVLRRGALPGSERWLITDMYPGPRPLAEVEAALMRVAVERPGGFGAALADPTADLASAFEVLLPPDGELLLIVDQFEELFTLTTSVDQRQSFLDLLTRLVSEPSLRVRVLLTMRADFYDRPLEYPEFGELVRRGLVSVTMPPREQLHDAITGPAARVGVTVDEGLVETIVNDVAGQPGGLPLMEYALTELFERRSEQRLTLAAYNQTAGVMGALGRRAEGLYGRYDEQGRDAARQVFLRLVTVEAGSEDTRRRIPLSELQGLGIDSTALQAVLEDFGEHRLLTFDRDPDTREPTVEVAHEALLSRWERLRVWIDDRRGDLASYRRLAASAKEWTDSGGAEEYLLTGGRLEHYLAFAAETDLFLTSTDAEYLAASREYDSELANRRRRRRRAIMAGFGVAAMIATVLAVVALLSRRQAEENLRLAEDKTEEAQQSEGFAQRQTEIAEEEAARAEREERNAEAEALRARASELAAYAAQVLDEDPNLSLLLLNESMKTAEPTDDVIASLHETLLQHRLIMRPPEPYAGGVLSPDGGMVISFAEETYAAIEVPSGRIIWEKPQIPEEEIGSEFFTVDGDAVLGLQHLDDEPTRVVRIDAATGERTFYPIESEYPIHDIVPNGSGHIDPDQPLIARRVEEPPTAAVLRLDLAAATAETVATYSTAAISRGFWTTDAAVTKVALGLNEKTIVLNLQTRETRGFGPTSDYEASQTLSPDGTLVITTNSLGNNVWNVAEDKAYWTIPGDLRGVAIFSVDGERVFLDNRVYSDDGQTLIVLPTADSAPQPSADGRLVLVGDQVLNLGPAREAGSVDLPTGGGYWAGIDYHGNTGVALHMEGSAEGGSSFGDAHVYGFIPTEDSMRGEVRLQIPTKATGDPALSADGRLAALQQEVQPNWFGAIGLFDTSSGELVTQLPGLCPTDNNAGPGPECRNYPETPFSGVTYHTLIAPDGSFLAATLQTLDSSLASKRALVVWDLASGDMTYQGEERSWVGEPILSPAGDRLLALEWLEVGEGEEGSGRLVVLDTATWEEVGGVPWGEGEELNPSVEVLRYGPDGSLLRWGVTGLSQLEDVSWEVIRQGEEPDCFLRDPQFSPDGSTIAATCWFSGEVVVYDAATLSIESHIATGDPELRGIKFFGDSELLVIGQSGPGLILQTDTEKLIQLARDRVVGEFSEEECEAYDIDSCPSRLEAEEESG